MDLLRLTGGTIRTLDERRPQASGLTVAAGRIASLEGDGSGAIDLGGRCVLPGFSDAHTHFATWALGLSQPRLEGCRSREEAAGRVAGAVTRTPPGRWVRGLGWRDADWANPPAREVLDAVCGDVPVALMSRDYHSL